jgi:hypothetical protein
MHNEWVTKALLQWKNEGIELNPPSKPEIIKLAEEKLSFNFPVSFKNLYLEVDGFKGNDWRENMFSIWPIERILSEFNESEDKTFIGFSDFLINSYALGFYKDLDGIYKDVDRHFPVAKTFEECIDLINSDSLLIY